MEDIKLTAAAKTRLIALRQRADVAREVHDAYVVGLLEGNGVEEVDLSKVSVDFDSSTITIED